LKKKQQFHLFFFVINRIKKNHSENEFNFTIVLVVRDGLVTTGR